jgi:poly(U)-specific endoribonuclease
MDQDFESLYREIYADLTVDREEAKELQEKIESANPPPDKLVKLRASVFKVGLEFLSEDDNENNLSLLRTMNAIVHALEMTCMT